MGDTFIIPCQNIPINSVIMSCESCDPLSSSSIARQDKWTQNFLPFFLKLSFVITEERKNHLSQYLTWRRVGRSAGGGGTGSVSSSGPAPAPRAPAGRGRRPCCARPGRAPARGRPRGCGGQGEYVSSVVIVMMILPAGE